MLPVHQNERDRKTQNKHTTPALFASIATLPIPVIQLRDRVAE
jgi:hypothetical protein